MILPSAVLLALDLVDVGVACSSVGGGFGVAGGLGGLVADSLALLALFLFLGFHLILVRSANETLWYGQPPILLPKVALDWWPRWALTQSALEWAD